ncbi:hypothetical protein ACOMCU_27880 [Lysinibacillus sp. UGB7]|uniref:hypothetical protein n=1 Tax=Lysinibacillus sp. UGB7 TaxID=3411039 RepID=UPI003B7B2DD3
MDILFSAIIVIIYVGLMYFIFGQIMNFMKQKTTDFMAQILPGWILIMLSSIVILFIFPDYLTSQRIFQFIMYISIGVCFVSLFLLIVIKNISLEKYNSIISKLKANRDIK